MAPTQTACGGRPTDAPHITLHGGFCPAWCAAGRPQSHAPDPPYTSRKGMTTFAPTQLKPEKREGKWTGDYLLNALGWGDPDDDLHTALDGVRALLRMMGEDPTRPGLADTPARVVKAYMELADRPGDPHALLAKVFDDVDSVDSEMIAVPGISFVSLCEHHLLPFTGTATVAYIPNGGGVVGLSKIPRLVQHYARRPQVQERLTTQIVDTLVDHLQPLGAAVLIESTHACMALRGVRAQEATMVTSALRGRFLENPPTRAEFMALATRGR